MDSAVQIRVPSLLGHVALVSLLTWLSLRFLICITGVKIPVSWFMRIHSFIHPFNKHLLSTCCVPGTVLDAGDTAEHKTDTVLALVELSF